MTAICRNRQCGRPCGDFLCWDCIGELDDCLEGIPWLLEQLAVTEQRLDRVSTGLRSGATPTAPLLFDERAADLLSALTNSLTTWTRHLCESRGIEYVPVGGDYIGNRFVGPPRRGQRRVPADFVDTINGVALWLHEHSMSVRLDEAAGQIHADITRAVAAGMVIINPPPMLAYRGPCPAMLVSGLGPTRECGFPLYAERDELDVTCVRCKSVYRSAKLEQHLLARIGGRLFEVPELIGVLRELNEPVPRGTIASWISRGQLVPRGWQSGDRVVMQRQVKTDRALYRLDDARKLRAQATQARGSTA
ncbi:hypothetical protein [Nocardia pseudovaccinii]|uniref:hypothetical protein n=1 Tax=Nocardia pseudovaccinii TaxID=189540 RepID=UPI0007A3BE11|nr:hypothetical protein [Nocardia pseudovaccinii]